MQRGRTGGWRCAMQLLTSTITLAPITPPTPAPRASQRRRQSRSCHQQHGAAIPGCDGVGAVLAPAEEEMASSSGSGSRHTNINTNPNSSGRGDSATWEGKEERGGLPLPSSPVQVATGQRAEGTPSTNTEGRRGSAASLFTPPTGSLCSSDTSIRHCSRVACHGSPCARARASSSLRNPSRRGRTRNAWRRWDGRAGTLPHPPARAASEVSHPPYSRHSTQERRQNSPASGQTEVTFEPSNLLDEVAKLFPPYSTCHDHSLKSACRRTRFAESGEGDGVTVFDWHRLYLVRVGDEVPLPIPTPVSATETRCYEHRFSAASATGAPARDSCSTGTSACPPPSSPLKGRKEQDYLRAIELLAKLSGRGSDGPTTGEVPPSRPSAEGESTTTSSPFRSLCAVPGSAASAAPPDTFLWERPAVFELYYGRGPMHGRVSEEDAAGEVDPVLQRARRLLLRSSLADKDCGVGEDPQEKGGTAGSATPVPPRHAGLSFHRVGRFFAVPGLPQPPTNTRAVLPPRVHTCDADDDGVTHQRRTAASGTVLSLHEYFSFLSPSYTSPAASAAGRGTRPKASSADAAPQPSFALFANPDSVLAGKASPETDRAREGDACRQTRPGPTVSASPFSSPSRGQRHARSSRGLPDDWRFTSCAIHASHILGFDPASPSPPPSAARELSCRKVCEASVGVLLLLKEEWVYFSVLMHAHCPRTWAHDSHQQVHQQRDYLASCCLSFPTEPIRWLLADDGAAATSPAAPLRLPRTVLVFDEEDRFHKVKDSIFARFLDLAPTASSPSSCSPSSPVSPGAKARRHRPPKRRGGREKRKGAGQGEEVERRETESIARGMKLKGEKTGGATPDTSIPPPSRPLSPPFVGEGVAWGLRSARDGRVRQARWDAVVATHLLLTRVAQQQQQCGGEHARRRNADSNAPRQEHSPHLLTTRKGRATRRTTRHQTETTSEGTEVREAAGQQEVSVTSFSCFPPARHLLRNPNWRRKPAVLAMEMRYGKIIKYTWGPSPPSR